MTNACVIVIGHVDHGKTALVRALTGTDTDRLAEEKKRGLSIALGFAHCDLPGGTVDLIDAPGHEDFTRAMVAGATGAQAALLVVAADEGVAAQTIEHLRIATLLALPVCLVAVTKTDLLAPDAVTPRLAEIADSLASLGVTGVGLVPCSAVSPDGCEGLRQTLGALLPDLPPALAPDFACLPVDRVFTVEGRGTVVTGTLLGGGMRVGETVSLLPGATETVIRGIQTRGQSCETVRQGARTALNLRGISVTDVARGDVICAPGRAAPSRCFDVYLTLMETAARGVRHMQEIRVSFGTAQDVATLRLMGGGQVAPGESCFAQLRFRKPVAGFAGQRIVLRGLSPAVTLGGALLLDPQARAIRSTDRDHLALMQAALDQNLASIAQTLCVEGKGVALMSDLARLGRATKPPLPAGFVPVGSDRFAPAQLIADMRTRTLERLGDFHRANPLKQVAPAALVEDRSKSPDLLRAVLGQLSADDIIRIDTDGISLADHDPWSALTDTQQARLAAIETHINDGGMSPPDIAEVLTTAEDADLCALLISTGRLVALVNVGLNQRFAFHQHALERAKDGLRQAFPKPARFTTGQARAALGTSRKFIVPVLEYFDAQGLTVRKGDWRQMVSDVGFTR